MKRKPNNQTTRATTNNSRQTFVEHIEELRGRLFWIVIAFLVATAAIYPFHQKILNVLFAPLKGQELIYLTPMGGFSFIIKICTYVGIIMVIPLIIYHLYKFLHPIMPTTSIKAKRFFTFSLFLAIIGIAFAYFVLLPTALNFLTSVDIQNVTAMLTVESYLNFVIAYIVGSVLMFQIPVLILLFNNITPIPPAKLMKFQKYIILGAFIFAAILSPTPDAINQGLMALPMIVMYQIAILLVIIINRNRITKELIFPIAKPAMHKDVPETLTRLNPLISHSSANTTIPIMQATRQSQRSVDGIIYNSKPVVTHKSLQPKTENYKNQPRQMRTTDGFFRPVTHAY